MTFNKSIVIDARDLPQDAEDWLMDEDVSTHYVHTLVMIWREHIPPEGNPVLNWLKAEGIDIEEYANKTMYFISIIGT